MPHNAFKVTHPGIMMPSGHLNVCCFWIYTQSTSTTYRYAILSEIKSMGFYATFVHKWAKLGQENFLRMVRWMRWHYPPDARLEIRALADWGRTRYILVAEVPHNIEYLLVSGEETFPLKLEGKNGVRTRDFRLSKEAALTTAPGPPPSSMLHTSTNIKTRKY